MKALSSGPQRGPATPLYVSKEGLYAMAVSPDSKHLATASKDGVTRVFDLATAQLSGGFKVPRCDAVWALLMACSSAPAYKGSQIFPIAVECA